VLAAQDQLTVLYSWLASAGPKAPEPVAEVLRDEHRASHHRAGPGRTKCYHGAALVKARAARPEKLVAARMPSKVDMPAPAERVGFDST
jgi:hypothetical protein